MNREPSVYSTTAKANLWLVWKRTRTEPPHLRLCKHSHNSWTENLSEMVCSFCLRNWKIEFSFWLFHLLLLLRPSDSHTEILLLLRNGQILNKIFSERAKSFFSIAACAWAWMSIVLPGRCRCLPRTEMFDVRWKWQKQQRHANRTNGGKSFLLQLRYYVFKCDKRSQEQREANETNRLSLAMYTGCGAICRWKQKRKK